MASIYMIRHQAAGFIPEFIFAAEPTQQQFDTVAALCLSRYGATHPKLGHEYWIRFVEVPLLDTADIEVKMPDLNEVGGNTARAVAVDYVVDAVGTVTPAGVEG